MGLINDFLVVVYKARALTYDHAGTSSIFAFWRRSTLLIKGEVYRDNNEHF